MQPKIRQWRLKKKRRSIAASRLGTCHTHVDGRIVRTCLGERLALMRDGGYRGCWGIEQTTDGNEYHEMAWMHSELVRANVI